MTQVTIRPNESQSQLFRRFKRQVSKAGSLALVRRKRWHIPKSEERRIKKKKALRRSRRTQRVTR